ncbi:MAG: hypothetical protein M3044_09830 [Thermoproteota archaeon]|nr:hypothetical protein [Thermoproteota archaeon]
MHKQTAFAIAAIIMVTAIVSASIYTVKAANAQSNMTSAGSANMTKSNMTNATGGGAKNMTGPVMGAAGGSAGGAKNMTGK